MQKRNFWLWAFYDFANSLGFIVLSFYFVLWFSVDAKQSESLISIVLALSTIVLLATLPIFGKYSDKIKKRKPFLVFCTICSIATLGGLGISAVTQNLGNLWGKIMVLILYFLFQYFYQASLAFYDSFLQDFTNIKTAEKISGIGMVFGQLGNIIGIILVLPIAQGKIHIFGATGRPAVFLAAAIFYFIAFLPVWFFLKEETQKNEAIKENLWESPKEIVKNLKKHPGVIRYLCVYYLFADAILTLQVFLSLYFEKVMGFTDQEKTILLIAILILSTIGALVSHFFTKIFTSTEKAIRIFIAFWTILLVLFAITTGKIFFTIIILLNGFAFGVLFSLSRAYYSNLIPKEKQAELFSIYVLFERAASIMGPLLWSLTVTIFVGFGNDKYRFGVIVLAFLVGMSFCLFRPKK